ncbi:MAG TPA: GNAT family N-acetyltransferase [Longimicrobiales bacterium]|nr:GNAT family N-acetyltransferase [Longimicrobiales bacterium]
MIRAYTLRDLSTSAEFQTCHQLQIDTWGASFSELVPVAILRLAQRLGGVVAGAFDHTDQMVGFVFGLPGIERGVPVHWSDMLAVRADARNQGLGEALKRHQRAVLLERGVQRMYWTFDPLEAKNAYFNFVRLGIIVREYARNLYGNSDSPLHRGIGTDRLIAIWELSSPRVIGRLAHDESPVRPALRMVNPRIAVGDAERCAPPVFVDEPAVGIAIPRDIHALKEQHPTVARDWRQHTRAAFEHYLSRGYVVTDFTRAADGVSYVLEEFDQ